MPSDEGNPREIAVSLQGRRHVPIRRLYGSHLLAQFGDRLWQFAVPILFISVWTDTLLPSAIFQFLLTSVRILFVPAVGRRVDTTDRLKLVRYGTFGQNLCMFLSGALLAVLYWRVEEDGKEFGDDNVDLGLFVALSVIGIVGDLFNIAGKLGVEKDWVVVIVDEEVSRGDVAAAEREDRLAQLNATLRRIDLSCKILAPLMYGVAVTVPKTRHDEVVLGTGIVCAWSLLSTWPIYWAWRSVYFEYAELQSKRPSKKQNPFSVLLQGGKAYATHACFVPSISFCWVYFTVLSDHHPLTTAFLKMDGVSNAALGAARGGGAFTGIAGTFLFPILRGTCGLVPAKLFESWAFVCCIVPISLLYLGLIPQEFMGDHAALYQSYLLLGAIVLSRVFLWGFDLANVQTMQEMVEVDVRGEMNGMQSAACSVMEFAMAVLSLFCTTHQNFRILVFASGAGVTLAAVGITLWACCCYAHRDAEPALTAISD